MLELSLHRYKYQLPPVDCFTFFRAVDTEDSIDIIVAHNQIK